MSELSELLKNNQSEQSSIKATLDEIQNDFDKTCPEETEKHAELKKFFEKYIN